MRKTVDGYKLDRNELLEDIESQIPLSVQAKNLQPLEVFCKKGSIKNFAKLTGKQLCLSLLF